MYHLLLVRTCIGLGLAFCLSSPAMATNFWLSTSGDIGTGSMAPSVQAAVQSVSYSTGTPSGSIFVWARPDTGKTLVNWSLNLLSTNSNILTFSNSSVEPLNPILGNTGSPDNEDIVRWETADGPTDDTSSIKNIQGFSIFNINRTGVGIGPDSNGSIGTTYNDPFYDSDNDAWLLAQVDYTLNGTLGQTDLFLQLGGFGLNNLGEDSADTNAVFGFTGDTALNGDTGRQQSSETPDAYISVVILGDYDGNGTVGPEDYTRWMSSFGSRANLSADGNGNGIVDAADYTVWRDNLATTSEGTSVPEPSGLLLLLLAMIAGLLMRPVVSRQSKLVFLTRPNIIRSAFALVFLAALAHSSHASNLYWDKNGNGNWGGGGR